jgi:uncharacterized protein YqeY
MKRVLLSFILLSATFIFVAAQESTPTKKFGYLSYDAVLKAMPSYAEAQKSFNDLKASYAKELERSESEFSKQFAEYVDGQKTFPENILLKRQKELQQLMEQSLTFKQEAQQLLDKAEKELQDLAIIQAYMPDSWRLTDEATVKAFAEDIVKRFIEKNKSITMKNMGAIIGEVKKKYPTADGKIVSDVVKSHIGHP